MVNRITQITDGLGPQADALRETALDLAATAKERFETGRVAAANFLHEKPAVAVGIAFGIGVALGWLIKRR